MADEVIYEPWPLEPCTLECPHADVCKLREPGGLKGGDWQSVHTCRLCMEKVLDGWDEDTQDKRLIVPDECPRWDALGGSALECGGCREERDELRRQHPRYAAQMEASKDLFGVFLQGIQKAAGGEKTPENVVDLDNRRAVHDTASKAAAAFNPVKGLIDLASEPGAQKDMTLAANLVLAMQGEAMKLPPMMAEWNRAIDNGLDEVREAELKCEWVESMYLALTRHRDDAGALVHEWMLTFTDRPPMSRAWHWISIPRRKLLLRTWEGIVRNSLV